MKKHKFIRDVEGGLIHVNACLDDWDDMLMIVDTAATYQGVLGLDFFEGTRFAVDMVDNTITVEQL